MGTIVHEYKPRGAARAIFSDKTQQLLVSGPVGTGKSRSILEKLHMICLARSNVRALMVRRTFTSLRTSVFETFSRHVAKEHIEAGLVTIYGGTVPRQVQYRNGSTIDLVGMDNSTRIMSTEYDIIYVAEAIELEHENWIALSSRLRGVALSYRQLIADTNPSHEAHWLNQLCRKGTVKMVHSRLIDNPRFYNEDGSLTSDGQAYVEGVLSTYEGVFKERLVEGKWVSAEGAVYDNFDQRIHVIEPFEIPSGWARYWSVDFGMTNPFVCQMWAEDPDGRLYLYKELYQTNGLVEDHARRLKGLDEPRPAAIISDPADAEGRATLERHLGYLTTPAKKTVSDGIQAVQSRLKVQKDGKPRIFFFRNASILIDPVLKGKKPTGTLEEIAGYVWDPAKDVPVKENDHGMDAMRYMVAYKDLRVPFAMV